MFWAHGMYCTMSFLVVQGVVGCTIWMPIPSRPPVCPWFLCRIIVRLAGDMGPLDLRRATSERRLSGLYYIVPMSFHTQKLDSTALHDGTTTKQASTSRNACSQRTRAHSHGAPIFEKINRGQRVWLSRVTDSRLQHQVRYRLNEQDRYHPLV